jgi:dihydroorotate dehydrogenase
MERDLARIPTAQAQSVNRQALPDQASALYRLLRPWIFRLEPEQAHRVTLTLLRLAGGTLPGRIAMGALFPQVKAARPVRAFGLDFPNPVGLAAGYDKDALAWRGLALLGFGHIEIGTVTPRGQPGNPSPRIFRLVDDQAVVNRMGFPNQGADAIARRLRHRRTGGPVLGVSIGKNKATAPEDTIEDYRLGMRTFAALADYLAVNVSSPNTPGLRALQKYSSLHSLLAALAEERRDLQGELEKPIPILVKLAPDMTLNDLDQAVGAVQETGMDGVIVANTTVRRKSLVSSQADETGGLSGAPLVDHTVAMIETAERCTGGKLPVVASGGVMGPSDAQRMLEAGACLVQLYTGMIYGGPGLVRKIVKEIS